MTNVPNYQSSKPPMFQTTNVPSYQCSELPMFRATNVSSYHCFELPLFQVTMQPSNLATSPRTEKRETKCKNRSAGTEEREPKNENRGARTKVLKPKCKNQRTRTKEQNPRNKVLETKFLEQNPQIFRFSCGKIDQKSNFWNIVLLCSEREASCTFVGTRLCRPNKSDLPTADAAERSKTAVCRRQICTRRLILTKTIQDEQQNQSISAASHAKRGGDAQGESSRLRLCESLHSCAVAEYSNVNAKQRLDLINELGAFYREYRDRLISLGLVWMIVLG